MHMIRTILLSLALFLVLGHNLQSAMAQNPPIPSTSQTGNQLTPPIPSTSQTGNVVTDQNSTNKSGQASGFLLNVKLKNPLKVDTIEDAIKFIVNTLIKIALPVIVLFFIWSGLKFVLAQGKPEEIKKAKNIFWYTIIGTLLILGAWTITNAIIGTVNSIVN